MKKLRMLLCLLIVVCIIASSSITFSAMPKGKFPIQIISTREPLNRYELELVKRLKNSFNNSSNFRITNIDENRIMLGILMQEYIPSVVSSDVLATASSVNVYTLVWMVKPKNKHAYIIWYDMGRYQSYDSLTQYILKQAETMVWSIKNQYPYLLD